MIASQFITTAPELPGYRIARSLGLVRGVTVRSRSIVGTVGASIQSLFGGNITLWSELCEHARIEAYELMSRHAQELGANAVVAMRYDATEIAAGVTEVLAYGTAVVVERAA
ncbi:MAG TPA: YbjQ family protein [Thermoanaerobaculia bacterium]|nr:YbjQ family protein [Thermoanaerobaculia bacterium]